MSAGTSSPYPSATPAPNVADMNSSEQRKADGYDRYRDGCGLCHGIHGFFVEQVVVGVGLRALHPDCAERMAQMGFDIRYERRGTTR